jgi:hypothetical protein
MNRGEVHTGLGVGGPKRVWKHCGRCGNNIKVDLKEIKWKGVDFIHLAQDRDKWGADFHKFQSNRRIFKIFCMKLQ